MSTLLTFIGEYPPGGLFGRLALPLVSKSLLEIRERVLKTDILLGLRMTFLNFLLFFSSLDLASCLKLTVAFFGNEESREGAQAFMGLFEGPRTLSCIVILVAVWLVYNSSDVCFLVILCQLPRRRFAILVYSYWRLGCLKSVKGPWNKHSNKLQLCLCFSGWNYTV